MACWAALTLRQFSATELVHRPAEDVFTYIADYRNAPRVLDGVTEWRPTGRRSHGVGVRYRVGMRALGIGFGGVLELDEWHAPDLIGWHSVGTPIELRGRWTIAARRGGTEVTLAITYEPPGAAIGNALAAPIEALLRRRVQAAVRRMRDELERQAAG
jgi:uncharacterized membrane protein